MQHTLLGLAIACILALLAALIGPYFVDWGEHRAFFEQEASRLAGLKVRVGGHIKVSLLPIPSVTLGGIEIGPQAGSARLRAGALRVDLGLTPLMRGEVRAVEMHLGAPEFEIGLDSDGQIDWPAMQFATETLSIDRLRIDDGRVVLADARNGSRVVLDKLWFTGDVRSLTGPVRGEGAFVTGGALYGYRVNTGRLGDDGMRLRVSVDSDGPIKTELDGMLSVERAQPRFEGNLTVARLAGSVQADGKTALNESWQLTSKISASTQSILLQQVSFQYGAEERAAHLTGSAVLHLGQQPRLEGALSARQVDIDRLIATPQAPRRLPLAAIQTFAETFGGALRSGVPVTLGISVDALTIGGATLQAVGCDLRSDGTTWNLDKLEFRAPGFTQARLSGRLDPSATAVGFSGEVRIDARDPRTLLGWLAGRPSGIAALKPWQLRGHVTIAADRIAIERLRTEFDRGTIEGRLAYFLPAAERPARLDAELKAAELDLDALIGFADGAFADTGLERPREVALAVEIGKAQFAGFEARSAAARLKFDANGIAIERLTVADFGNAKVSASGRIDTSATPGGAITVDLDARELGGVIALVDRFAPPLADPLRLLVARRLNSAKLHATISLQRASAGAAAKLALIGNVGALRVSMNADATGKPEAFVVTDLRALEGADVRIDGRLEADDGGALLALAGLDRFAAGVRKPGSLSFAGHGPLSESLQIDTRLITGAIDVGAKATVRSAPGEPDELALEHVTGIIAGSAVRGGLAVTLADPVRVRGLVAVKEIAVPAVIAAAIGMPVARPGPDDGAEPAAWSTEPFALGNSTMTGRVELTAERAVLAPGIEARQWQGVVRFGASQIVFDEFAGQLGRGRLEGRLAIASGASGLTARARVALNGADASSLIAAGGRAITGRLGLEAEVEGSGMSPAAFVGSLSGSGRLSLDDAYLGGLNPRLFDAVIRAVDLGIPTSADRIRDFVVTTLDTGSLPVKRLDVPIAIRAGTARIGPFSVKANGADLEGSADISLADGALESQFILAGAPRSSDAARPAVSITLRGPVLTPRRSVDANSLTTWLAMRAVEQQAKHIEAIERAREEAAVQASIEAAREQRVPPSIDSTGAIPQQPAAGPAPPLPAPINVPAAPRPKAAPRAEITPAPAPRPAPRKPPQRSPGAPLNLLGGN